MRIIAFGVLAFTFFLSILTTLTMVFLEGFGFTQLPEAAFLMLIGKTIPELLAMMYIVIKYLFPAGSTA